MTRTDERRCSWSTFSALRKDCAGEVYLWRTFENDPGTLLCTRHIFEHELEDALDDAFSRNVGGWGGCGHTLEMFTFRGAERIASLLPLRDCEPLPEATP